MFITKQKKVRFFRYCVQTNKNNSDRLLYIEKKKQTKQINSKQKNDKNALLKVIDFVFVHVRVYLIVPLFSNYVV